jgi:hypothetical protein
LDHHVVLFDEIDELLRERQEVEADPFGRFLTTSMLPKVAELWDQRRVLFFVATNDIEHADRAIKRSQRFDAAIFVPPPSIDVKLARLREDLGGADHAPRISLAEVEEALGKRADENPLGYFALLRYDQIDELAAKLRATGRAKKDVEQALRDMGEQLNASDWHRWNSDVSEPTEDAFQIFNRERGEERRDYRMVRVVWLAGTCGGQPPPEFAVDLTRSNGTYLRLLPSPSRPPSEFDLGGVKFRADGLLRYVEQ